MLKYGYKFPNLFIIIITRLFCVHHVTFESIKGGSRPLGDKAGITQCHSKYAARNTKAPRNATNIEKFCYAKNYYYYYYIQHTEKNKNEKKHAQKVRI